MIIELFFQLFNLQEKHNLYHKDVPYTPNMNKETVEHEPSLM